MGLSFSSLEDEVGNYKIEKKDHDIYLTPKSGNFQYTLIWLHGLGDSAEGFLDFFTSSTSPIPNTVRKSIHCTF